MEWIESKIFTTHMGVEAVCALLMEAGVNGVQIEDDEELKNFLATNADSWDYVDEELLNKENSETVVKFYVSGNDYGRETILAVRERLRALQGLDGIPDMGRLELEMENVDDSEWLNNWKKYYKPFPVGKRIIIRPIWEDYENTQNKTVFTINPGHVFGTGLHQTTQLCIEELETYVSKQTNVLDLGCGSGILSIIALMLGAKHAVAVDLDPNASDIAYENAENNGVGKDLYRVYSGNILSDEGLRAEISKNRYGLVVANIVADVIIALAGYAKECILPGGIFICSGIITERLNEVVNALEANGFTISHSTSRDGWHCVVSKNGD